MNILRKLFQEGEKVSFLSYTREQVVSSGPNHKIIVKDGESFMTVKTKGGRHLVRKLNVL
jgi:DNA-directed RNA polymerase subunit L